MARKIVLSLQVRLFSETSLIFFALSDVQLCETSPHVREEYCIMFPVFLHFFMRNSKQVFGRYRSIYLLYFRLQFLFFLVSVFGNFIYLKSYWSTKQCFTIQLRLFSETSLIFFAHSDVQLYETSPQDREEYCIMFPVFLHFL